MSALAAALAIVALNHSVFAAAQFPLWLWAAWIAFAAACLARGPMPLAAPRPAERPTPWALALGVLAAVPAMLPLAVSVDREFGFGGDSSFHIGVAFRLALWWASPPFAPPSVAFDFAAIESIRAAPASLVVSRAALLVVGLGALAFAGRRHPRTALGVAAIALFVWGAAEAAREFRYPTLSYHATFPFLLPAALAGAPELAFRLSNAAAVAAWLFVLRPVVLKRWPDAPALAVAAFLFWNDAFLATLDAAYLEPWAVVFLALAVEARVRGGAAAAPLACVLVGFAAAAKEPAIFALPFVWLSALPWRAPFDRVRDTTLASLAAGLPFVGFFAVNRAIGQVRPVDFGLPGPAILNGLAEYGARFAESGGGWALAGFAIAICALALARERVAALAFAGAGVFLMLFFVVDRASLGYAGLHRFAWICLPALCAGLFACRDRRAAGFAVALCLVQAPGIAAAVERARADWAARSFSEYFDAPFVFPINSLFREAGLDPSVPVTTLRHDAVVLAGAAMGRQGAILDFVDEGPCACTQDRPNFMVLAPPATGYWAGGAVPAPGRLPEPERVARWQAHRAALPACAASLNATCGRVLTRAVDGVPVAILGVSEAERRR
ncbi:MAG: hypothetical protein ACK5XA_03255 [Tagaea sp.]